jgi:hypothetical protein
MKKSEEYLFVKLFGAFEVAAGGKLSVCLCSCVVVFLAYWVMN